MPVLLFPSEDALRLVITAGIIPHEIIHDSIQSAVDDSGRIWVETRHGAIHDHRANLQRLGVRFTPALEGAPHALTCWYQLLGMMPHAATDEPGQRLIAIPPESFNRWYTAALARRVPIRKLLITETADSQARVWVMIPQDPGMTWEDIDVRIATYWPQRPGFWARQGWFHPHLEQISSPKQSIWILDPPRHWLALPWESHYSHADEFPLHLEASHRVQRVPSASMTPVEVHLSLRQGSPAQDETYWLLDNDVDQLSMWLRETDERLLHRCSLAMVGNPDTASRVIVHSPHYRPVMPGEGVHSRSYTPYPGLPQLLIPSGMSLWPNLNRDRLARALDLSPQQLLIVDRGQEARLRLDRFPYPRFRPARECIRYTASRGIRLSNAWVNTGILEIQPAICREEPQGETPRSTAQPRVAEGPSQGWMKRSLNKLMKRLQARKPRSQATRTEEQPTVVPEQAFRIDRGSFHDLHLPSTEKEARSLRQGYEHKLIHELASYSRQDRAQLWANLAGLVGSQGPGHDVGLCYANAIWEAERPDAAWYEQWLRAEARHAKIQHPLDRLGEVITLSKRRVPIRLVAAYLAWAQVQSPSPADIQVRIPHLIYLLNERCEKLPLRMAWLAQRAAATLAQGDTLALARWHDATFERLNDPGPTLDLDAPECVRFHGRPSTDRYQPARDWLVRMWEPAHRWLARMASPRRLQWFGLDMETDASAAYLDLMFAWGANRLGERNTARDWEEAAVGVLGQRPGSGDAGVHTVLLQAFRHRIRDAQHGRPDRPGIPPDVYQEYLRLSNFQRYVVDQLRSVSSILEPVALVDPFRGRKAVGLRGADALAARLIQLDDLAPHQLDHEIMGLIDHARKHPGELPRIGLACIRFAPLVPNSSAMVLLGTVADIARQLPGWLWEQRSLPAEAHLHLDECFSELIEGTAQGTIAHDAGDVLRGLLNELLGTATAPTQVIQAALSHSGHKLMRALRRFQMDQEIEMVLALGHPPHCTLDERLTYAIGWFTLGNLDQGTRLLDEARDRLYSPAPLDPRARARLAIAYARTLGFAPSRMALGRLEEIIQRLDFPNIPSTANRFFSLTWLELLDAMIRSVVSDDYGISAEVRAWLEDQEFGTRRRISQDMDQSLNIRSAWSDRFPHENP